MHSPQVCNDLVDVDMLMNSTAGDLGFSALCTAATIIPFIAVSTGMIVDELSGLQYMVLMTPRAPPIIRPVGPFMLSIQPGSGSFHAAVTIRRKCYIRKNI